MRSDERGNYEGGDGRRGEGDGAGYGYAATIDFLEMHRNQARRRGDGVGVYLTGDLVGEGGQGQTDGRTVTRMPDGPGTWE